MSTLLCETVTAPTMAGLIAAREAAATEADMVELRLDGVQDLDVRQAIAGRRRPVIVTCRPVWEGGRFDGAEETRHFVLSSALDAGADYVDVEWRALSGSSARAFDDLVRRSPRRVVMSSHDFSGVPADLAERARAMRATGAAVIKVAITPTRLSDTLILRDLARDGDAVVIGMGEAGLPTRLLAPRFGSRWTYGGHAVAPGQIPVARMVEEYRVRALGPATALYGVVGTHVAHSPSPAMHNAAFAATGYDAVYVPLCAADFRDFQVFAHSMSMAGASVTIPFKQDALRAAQQADDLTRRVGAANTLRTAPNGGWDATNTDVPGCVEPLAAAYGDLVGARVSVLGAGGVARAAVVALVDAGARVTVHARRREQSQLVARELGVTAGAWPPPAGTWDVLVNATPLGGASARDATPLPGGRFDGRLVYDLVYRRDESPLLRDARLAGVQTLDGLPMLVAQAERQSAWWTGTAPAAGLMRAAAERSVTRTAPVLAGQH